MCSFLPPSKAKKVVLAVNHPASAGENMFLRVLLQTNQCVLSVCSVTMKKRQNLKRCTFQRRSLNTGDSKRFSCQTTCPSPPPPPSPPAFLTPTPSVPPKKPPGSPKGSDVLLLRSSRSAPTSKAMHRIKGI